MAIIGISGGSGSGKTTFAAALADCIREHTGVTPAMFSADRYFNNPLPTMISPADGQEYPDWNHPDSVNYTALREDLLRCDSPIILAEGVTVFCAPAVRELMDVRIFVEASIEMRIYRRIKRNAETRGLSIQEIGEYYLRCARYREMEYALPSAVHADFTVSNEYGFDPDAAYARVKEILTAKGSFPAGI